MIRKAVIPAAGFGTRFLPASKSQPKEMLPIVDTPTIQHVVEEAVEAGVTDILMIIGKGKRAIEEHFDRHFDLEQELEKKNKTEELEQVRSVTELANVHFVWQKEMNGLGDAVTYARHHVGNEPFLLLLGDTLIQGPNNVSKRLCDTYERYGESVVLLEEVERDKVDRYGVIGGKEIDPGLFLVDTFVEKPPIDEAPSNLAIAARYVFTPQIFSYLDKTPRGKNNEVQLTDAMLAMLQDRAMYGMTFEGIRHDIGNKLDFLKTNVLYGIERDDFGAEFKQWLKDLSAEF